MVGHIVLAALGEMARLPQSRDSRRLLREDLGYSGVVFYDD